MSTAYEEGRKACRDGKRRSCPYKGTKKEVVYRVDWLQGFADQAREEADDALRASGSPSSEEERSSDTVSCNGHERIYEDGSGYICRHCGVDMDGDA